MANYVSWDIVRRFKSFIPGTGKLNDDLAKVGNTDYCVLCKYLVTLEYKVSHEVSCISLVMTDLFYKNSSSTFI